LEKSKTDEEFLKNLEIDVINVFDKMDMTKVSFDLV
jgi:hypothetical protein